MRKAVKIFSEDMEIKLQLNDGAKGKSGWIDNPRCTVKMLKNLLDFEMRELEKVIVDCNINGMMDECVDVANFAMMIYDRIKTFNQQRERE